MNLIKAIVKLSQGATIVSCIGRIYTYDMLQPKWFGEHYASFKTCEMTDIEKKNNWTIKGE